MIKRWFLFAIFCAFFIGVLQGEECYGSVEAVYRGLYDGDTIYVDIPGYPAIVGENIAIRVAGIDTPEIRGDCEKEKQLAQNAKKYADSILRGKKVTLRNISRGKYFRIVAEVWVNNSVNLGNELLKAGLAIEYDGSKKTFDWCQ